MCGLASGQNVESMFTAVLGLVIVGSVVLALDPKANYAINPTPELDLRSNRAILPARVIAALDVGGRMSDLSAIEKRKLELALDMPSGYVLGFSNRTFEEFFLDNFQVSIYSEKYASGSGSKAARMRAFWNKESNFLVHRVLNLMFTGWTEFKGYGSPKAPPPEIWPILERLKSSAPVPEIGAISPNENDESFDALASAVRDAIDRNVPQTGLDRLHTFLVRYFRVLCTEHGISTEIEKPLHSLVGEYIKTIRTKGLIQSDMTERILRSTISVMEAFNQVRNTQSLAHDNKILNYDESLLIFGHVCSSVRFVEALERKRKAAPEPEEPPDDWDDIPF